MARTRLVKHEGIDYFAGWPDRTFWPWLAGFFDGEGCIHLPKNHVGIDVSVSNTNRDLIESLHRHVGMGYIEEITFDQPGWNTKYSWRVRRYADARHVIIQMREWLTIKADAADAAMLRIAAVARRASETRGRHADVVRLSNTGMAQKDIAEQLNLNRGTVSVIISRAKARGLSPADIEDERETPLLVKSMRAWTQKHTKPTRSVTTARKRLPTA